MFVSADWLGINGMFRRYTCPDLWFCRYPHDGPRVDYSVGGQILLHVIFPASSEVFLCRCRCPVPVPLSRILTLFPG